MLLLQMYAKATKRKQLIFVKRKKKNVVKGSHMECDFFIFW